MIYSANAHSATVSGIWWWIAFPVIFVVTLFLGLFMLAMSINEYIDPRSRLARMGAWTMDAALSVRNLRAYYVTDYFGIKREVRAVDITLSVKKNEIYGIAGKSWANADFHQNNRRRRLAAAPHSGRFHQVQLSRSRHLRVQ